MHDVPSKEKAMAKLLTFESLEEARRFLAPEEWIWISDGVEIDPASRGIIGGKPYTHARLKRIKPLVWRDSPICKDGLIKEEDAHE